MKDQNKKTKQSTQGERIFGESGLRPPRMGIAITLECGQGAIKLLAEDVQGEDTQRFAPGPGNQTLATAKTTAQTNAETKAKDAAKNDITRQQNETKCGSKCNKKDAPAPTSELSKTTVVDPPNFEDAAHTKGTVKATAWANGHGTVQCKS